MIAAAFLALAMPPNALEPVTWCVQRWDDFTVAEEACHDPIAGMPLTRPRPTSITEARKVMLEYAGKIMTADQLKAWSTATSLSTVPTSREVVWYLPADEKRYVKVTMHRHSRDILK